MVIRLFKRKNRSLKKWEMIWNEKEAKYEKKIRYDISAADNDYNCISVVRILATNTMDDSTRVSYSDCFLNSNTWRSINSCANCYDFPYNTTLGNNCSIKQEKKTSRLTQKPLSLYFYLQILYILFINYIRRVLNIAKNFAYIYPCRHLRLTKTK